MLIPLIFFFKKYFDKYECLPKFFISDVISDDSSVTLLRVGFIPHHLQLSRGQRTDPNIFRTSLWPLPVGYELQQAQIRNLKASCHNIIFMSGGVAPSKRMIKYEMHFRPLDGTGADLVCAKDEAKLIRD